MTESPARRDASPSKPADSSVQTDDHDFADSRRSLLFNLVVYILVGAALLWFDPLDFDKPTLKMSQDLANLFITGEIHSRRDKDPGVAAVIVGDGAVTAMQEPWPWPLLRHAQALDAILTYRPRALVIDVLFADERTVAKVEGEPDELDQFVAVLKAYGGTGHGDAIPVFLVGNPSTPEHPLRGDLLKKLAADKAGFGHVYLINPVLRPGDRSLRILPATYHSAPMVNTPLKDDNCADWGTSNDCRNAFSAMKNGEAVPSAAFQVINTLCKPPYRRISDTPDKGDRGDTFCGGSDSMVGKDDLTLIYGTRPHKIFGWQKELEIIHCGPDTPECPNAADQQRSKLKDCAGPPGFFGRLWKILVDREGLIQRCPYLPELPVERLFAEDTQASAKNGEKKTFYPGPDDAEESASKIISDKIVVYGAFIEGFGDVFETPTHGLQPGARIHAAAIDNLLVYGRDGYLKPPGQFLLQAGPLRPIGYYETAMVALTAFCAGSAIAIWRKRLRNSANPYIRHFPRALRRFFMTVMIFIIGIALAMLFYWLGFWPVNWIAALSVFGFLSLVMKGKLINDLRLWIISIGKRILLVIYGGSKSFDSESG